MISQPKIDITNPGASAAFDPPVVRPGEWSTYRVTFNALEESIEWPGKLTLPSNFEVRAGAHGHMFQMTGPAMVPLTTFNYHVRAPNPGQFSVAEFVVQVYGQPVNVPAARLEVSSAPSTSSVPPLNLTLEIAETNLFVGQSVKARVLLPASAGGVVQGLAQVQLSGEGFLVDMATAHQTIGPMQRNGSIVTTFVHETTLTPITTGKISVLAQGFTAGGPFFGVIHAPAIIPGGAPQYTLLDSEPVELQVRPLPKEGELPGFTGAIGSFSLDPPTLATNALRVGDPVKLTVTIHGSNLARLVAPPPPRVQDWQLFAPISDGAPPQFIQMRGFATFIYTLIPLTEQTRATPAIPFSCFDPQPGRYVDLSIPPVPVIVTPGANSADSKAWLQPALVKSDQEPVLSGLAAAPGRTARSLAPIQQNLWFPLLQLVPATAFLGIWSWDRRRRYLEHHPDILVRRRARRALRREWRTLRQAARIGDVERFATASVNAMRVACAPHYPAEPRALVGSDVLQVLREPAGRARLSSARRSTPHPAKWGAEARRALPLLSALGGEQCSWGLTAAVAIPTYAPSFQAQADHPNNWDKTNKVVRSFFAVTDATRFDTETADSRELLSLQLELERVLEELEARL